MNNMPPQTPWKNSAGVPLSLEPEKPKPRAPYPRDVKSWVASGLEQRLQERMNERRQEQNKIQEIPEPSEPQFSPIEMSPKQRSDWEQGIMNKRYGLAQNSPWGQFKEPAPPEINSGWGLIRSAAAAEAPNRPITWLIPRTPEELEANKARRPLGPAPQTPTELRANKVAGPRFRQGFIDLTKNPEGRDIASELVQYGRLPLLYDLFLEQEELNYGPDGRRRTSPYDLR